MKSEKEKAKEILQKRDEARKGLAPRREGKTGERAEKEEKKVADSALVVGLGAKRSG
jgi:hypothetical protein